MTSASNSKGYVVRDALLIKTRQEC